jgi:hypothetical protein
MKYRFKLRNRFSKVIDKMELDKDEKRIAMVKYEE